MRALKGIPLNSDASYLLGAALRRQGHWDEAVAILEPLTRSQPQMALVWYELAEALASRGERAEAIAALLRTVDLDCLHQGAWYLLGDLLDFPDGGPANAASVGLQEAEAIKLLADAAIQKHRWGEAEDLLERCLERAPDFAAARFRFVTLRFVRKDLRQLLPHIDELLRRDPDNALYRLLRALTLSGSQQYRDAVAAFEAFIDRTGSAPGVWLAYGRALRGARSGLAVTAYQKAIQIQENPVWRLMSDLRTSSHSRWTKP